MRPTPTLWVREMMVSSSVSGFSLTSKKRVLSQGSSKIFSSALAASLRIFSGNQMITLFHSPSKAL